MRQGTREGGRKRLGEFTMCVESRPTLRAFGERCEGKEREKWMAGN